MGAGLAIVAVAALVGVGILLLIIRQSRGGNDGGGLEDGRARVAADGFFVRAFPAGSRVHWRALVNGTWRTGVAEIAGSETFVYTGGTPSEIELKSIGGGAVPAPVSAPAPSSSNDDDSSSDAFAGFPSAY